MSGEEKKEVQLMERCSEGKTIVYCNRADKTKQLAELRHISRQQKIGESKERG
jgi:hypothetical protein